MQAQLYEIKIGSEFYVFRSEADATAAAGAMMRGGRTVSSGRGVAIEPVAIEICRRTINVTQANVQRVLGVK